MEEEFQLITTLFMQVDNNTELETTGPTYYSSKLPYNTTLLVNISGHNCAGYSDPVTLELHYNHTSNQGIVFLAIFTITIASFTVQTVWAVTHLLHQSSQ